MKHKYWLEAVLLCGVMQSAPAQSILKNKDEKELSLLLNEVVVTGTGTEHYLKDAPVQTEVLTGKALDQYQARSIDDLLSGLSPSLTFHDGDMGSHIQLNGLNNDYILIMINGKRMNGDIGGQNDLNQLNPANIERIEIVKGAASVALRQRRHCRSHQHHHRTEQHEKTELTCTSRVGAHGDVRAKRQSLGLRPSAKRRESVTGVNFRHTDGWRNTDLQWDQQPAEARLHHAYRQPLQQLHAVREPGLAASTGNRTLAADIGLVLRTLGGAPARPVEATCPTTPTTATMAFAAGGRYRLDRTELPHRPTSPTAATATSTTTS